MTERETDSRAPRRAALAMIDAVTRDGAALSEASALTDGMAPPDKARALRLATETLRLAERADHALKPYIKNAPRDALAWMLRLGVWELVVDGAGAHGVVNDLVGIAGERRGTERGKGLINAVLRKIADNPPDWAALPAPRMPRWLRAPLSAAYGKARVAAMEAAHAVPAPLDLTVKTAGDVAALAEVLNAREIFPGTLRLSERAQVSALPGYDEGQWWVQDAAASVPARLLAARPGEAVLDMCAAPGGKTMQLAATGASVTAIDVSEKRTAVITENLGRVGLSAQIVVADALEWQSAALFDAILLDAPCSATGTLRRHPDLPHIRDLSALDTLLPLQAALIDRAVALLKPGGRLVYCTCSLLREEGEKQVEAALERHAGLARGDDHPDWLPDAVRTPKGVRFTPDQAAEFGGWDGFYIARLSKADSAG